MKQEDKRIFLAAHAPKDIPEEFVHKVPQRPKEPIIPHPLGRKDPLAYHLRRSMQTYMAYDRSRAAVKKPIELSMFLYPTEGYTPFDKAQLEKLLAAFYKKAKAYHAAMQRWEIENIFAREAQWPWAWADMVLKYE